VLLTVLGLLAAGPWRIALAATQPDLSTAARFAVLGGSAVTNTGSSVISGDLGVYPGTSVSGFPPGTLNGTQHINDAVAQQAQSDLTTAYNTAAAQPPTQDLTGKDLGGMVLTPGVYRFSSSAGLTGALTLDAQGSSNAVFIFQIGSTLTTASAATVRLINGAQECGLWWQIGSSATLGSGTTFRGSLMALTSITLNTGANIPSGRALARNGALTLDTNRISIPTSCSLGSSPSPTTAPSSSASASPSGGASPSPTLSTSAIPSITPAPTPSDSGSSVSSPAPAPAGLPSVTPTPGGSLGPSPSPGIGVSTPGTGLVRPIQIFVSFGLMLLGGLLLLAIRRDSPRST